MKYRKANLDIESLFASRFVMASDSWDTYLSSWSSANPLINVRNIRARITDKRKVKRLFSKEGKVNVRVTGVDSLAGQSFQGSPLINGTDRCR